MSILGREAEAVLARSAKAREKLDKLRSVLLADSHYGTAGTPADVVAVENKMTLHRLRRDDLGPVRHAPPVLLVPSLINRYYVLDLLPGRSFAGFLGSQGFDVYLVDWGEPTQEDRFNDLAHYLHGMLHRCVRTVAVAARTDDVSMVGYCMGGVFALLYAALHPERIRNLVLLAAPIDQDVEGGVAQAVRVVDFPKEDEADPRLIPAREVKGWFEMLAPGTSSGPGRWLDLWARLDQDETRLLDVKTMATWMDDNVPVPGRLMGEFTRMLGPGVNGFMNGGVRVGDTPVEMNRVTMPVYAVSAEQDTIVPCGSADAIAAIVPHATVRRLPGGHVGIVAGKAAAQLWQVVAGWLGERSTALR